MSLQTIGKAIRRARLAKGLTQERLARLAGLSRTTINQMEGGFVSDLGIRKVAVVAERVGLAIDMAPLARRTSVDPFRIACVASSVGFREKLDEDDLVKALATGKVPTAWRPHLRALLDEVPAVVLRQVLARLGGIQKLARNVKLLAADLQCSRDPESWLTAD